MLYHMLVSSGQFPAYRTEPAVFDLLAPRFGDFRKVATRQKMLNCWLRSRQFRRSGLDPALITKKVMQEVRTHGEFLRVVMDAIAVLAGCRRWAAWGPDNLLYLDIIKRQIPDAIFIHVVRDGRDVAFALDRKKFIHPFPWDRSQRLFVSSLHWQWKVERGRAQGRRLGADYLEVKFEDIVSQPANTLASIGRFVDCDLDYARIRTAEIGAVGRPNTSFVEELQLQAFSPAGRWRRQLPPETVSQLEALIGNTLVNLGYELSQPVAPLGARRRALGQIYPRFYDMKEWLKMNTPAGRLININRLHLDEMETDRELIVHPAAELQSAPTG